MEQKMLINTAHPEEWRIAITTDDQLVELEIESQVQQKLKGNIYRAKIVRVEPSLQAAFVDIGSQRNGFLQINDIHPAYFRNQKGEGGNRRERIQDLLEAGQELVVQVVKEEREMKGATLTTYLSLPGRYLVLMPGSDRGGVSRKIVDSDQRQRLKTLAQDLELPSGIGLIIRTAGLDRSEADLSRDLALQLKLWERIMADAQNASCPTILYKESDLATRVVRDYFTPEIREILIDQPSTYARVKEFVGQVMPRYRSRVKLYEGEMPIFAAAGIEEQVHVTMHKEVQLPSGGALVIDSLEALTAIDVNSGKATAGGNIEETAYRTNLEAAEEIARQLRLRDLGGLIVIDFIDMLDRRHRSNVEERLEEAVASDKARVEVGKLSKFGLLEMSRQRLRASLASQSRQKCHHCHGVGSHRAPELVALEILRKLQAAIVTGSVSVAKVRMSPGPALYLLNNKRSELSKLENAFGAAILVLADGRLIPDEYQLELERKPNAAPVPEVAAQAGPRAPAPDAALAQMSANSAETQGEEGEEQAPRTLVDDDD
jgi:ribonuclease E